MSFQNDDRQMFEVNEKCSECGAAITKLPFQPSGDRPLKCLDCFRAGRPSRNNNGPRQPRQMYDVNLECAECGTKITQLPFQPSGDRPVFCFDCNKAKRDR
jgi:CxxC-x17-CxxC domain-containing protein